MKSISLVAQSSSLICTMALNLSEFIADNELYGPLIIKRIEETRLTSDQQLRLTDYPNMVHMVVILNAEDPDTIAVLPVLARIDAAAPRLDLHIITDEDDLTLLDAMVEALDLSDLDELDLPLVIFFDEEWADQGSWGPRPAAAEPLLEAWLEEHPDYETLATDESDDAQDAFGALQDELIHAMRLWYNTSVNRVCVDEIIDVLDSLASADDATSDDDEEDESEES